ncbi:MAG: sulfatase-like hydrolase/transferase [Pseudomonadales bacterium]|jgi:arylsulfatase A-like enzyme|nr:sulfatase-like hydrolase/transferase [Pseudomonadales bacterium]MDP6472155.1 sulfatase-like hydrolase/transferase [Pseudomonadales bacterium]MDP6826593.1 sulfatase-like hydrolase/transferase [Pseudomonadales bacterium]MDP6970136.1 sulfatase-like hydrolase/transferase [Pseudomonadales bacterium]
MKLPATASVLCIAVLLTSGGCSEPGDIAAHAGPRAPNQLPNIVLVLADDLGIGDVGAYGGETIATPHLDKLAASGVRFSNGYVSHPVCSPSRAGLITGTYQQRHGWEFNPAGRDLEHGMSVEVPTLADMLSAAGYDTAMIGKWHLGHNTPHHPLDRGFDHYFGILAGGSLYIDPQYPGVENAGRVAPKRDQRISVYRGRRAVHVEEYLTDAFTDEAEAYIREARQAPFFLYLSYTAPHTPLQATKPYLDRYRHITDPAERVYAAMVSALDDGIGRLRRVLRETGYLDNTLIVFLSDNGCAGYLRGACSNAPYAGYKRYHQEGGIRVPFLLSWPRRLAAGQVRHEMISSLDLMNTFAAAAAHTGSSADGKNLLPWLTGEAPAPHQYLYWRSGPTSAVRNERWKLIRYNRTPFTAADLDPTGRLPAPPNGWPIDSPHGQMALLYDLKADPGETQNMARRFPDEVEHLSQAHRAWADLLPERALLPPIRSTIADMHGETVQLLF